VPHQPVTRGATIKRGSTHLYELLASGSLPQKHMYTRSICTPCLGLCAILPTMPADCCAHSCGENLMLTGPAVDVSTPKPCSPSPLS
jgi:hypothetical protein